MTNFPGTEKLDPLPEQFNGMTNIDVYAGIYPAAVYRHRGKQISFACVGTMFQTSPKHWSIILPEHLFLKDKRLGFKGGYVVRIARPDTGYMGFVDKVEHSPTGGDVAIATVLLGTNETVIEDNTEPIPPYITCIIPSPTVVICNQEVKTICSLITGKQVPIVGCGVEIQAKKPRRYLTIEMPCGPGSSGSAYFDQTGRIFIAHAIIPEDSALMKEVDHYWIEKKWPAYRRDPSSRRTGSYGSITKVTRKVLYSKALHNIKRAGLF